ncbi:phosphinothricin acetyltransferase [Fictibacillus enclensis]|uniref:GNAT family acetyltransferase n=1 Tax=Fictibacillus enclensis TaxID=1017270 RepID=A0A0V8J4A8_9BACL|nr:GNAT family N-acetyltransferase [Fictibacillus enclensis]KSU81893.1 GNAT family acetyltransferase [Fictibacillus enclensis]SCC27551.1 phosphinothricin acetyltransferase [Fictibacillus enclensis]
MVHIRDALPRDLPALLDIYNEAIRTLTATFDLEEQTLEQRKKWFEKYGGAFPLIVAKVDGKVAGYGSLSPFRDKEAYARTTEVSLYISSEFRGQGIGKELMKEILQRASNLGYHTVIGGITGGNESSVRLHKRFGFDFVGCLKEVGHKFDRWQDVHFYQLILDTEKTKG